MPPSKKTPAAGDLRTHTVTTPNGAKRKQVILLLGPVDKTGAVLGFPIGYVDEAASFQPDQLDQLDE
jgi:hypothetical protein